MTAKSVSSDPNPVVDRGCGHPADGAAATDLNEYFRKHHDKRSPDFPNAPVVTCADGLTLSVQASRYHYCAPRDSTGPWYAVEVGFPSAECPELMEWCESPDTPLETVYGYVPIEVVEKLIDAHGGMSATDSKMTTAPAQNAADVQTEKP